MEERSNRLNNDNNSISQSISMKSSDGKFNILIIVKYLSLIINAYHLNLVDTIEQPAAATPIVFSMYPLSLINGYQ